MLAEPQCSPRELFENQWPLIEAVIRWVCQRHSLRKEDAEDFASHAALRLIEDDYRVLRKFRGRSSLKTYLTTVISRLFLDYRIARWGKWRPCAAAKQAGPVGVRLDRLIFRDGYTVSEAVAIVAGDQRVVMDRAELAALAKRLPARSPRPVPVDESLAQKVAPGASDDLVSEAEMGRIALSVKKVLMRAFANLGAEDRLLLKLQFRDGLSVTAISRLLQLDQKGLYRRIHRLHSRLHAQMLAEGVRHEDVAAMLAWQGPWLPVAEPSAPPASKKPAKS